MWWMGGEQSVLHILVTFKERTTVATFWPASGKIGPLFSIQCVLPVTHSIVHSSFNCPWMGPKWFLVYSKFYMICNNGNKVGTKSHHWIGSWLQPWIPNWHRQPHSWLNADHLQCPAPDWLRQRNPELCCDVDHRSGTNTIKLFLP